MGGREGREDFEGYSAQWNDRVSRVCVCVCVKRGGGEGKIKITLLNFVFFFQPVDRTANRGPLKIEKRVKLAYRQKYISIRISK